MDVVFHRQIGLSNEVQSTLYNMSKVKRPHLYLNPITTQNERLNHDIMGGAKVQLLKPRVIVDSS